MSSYYILITPAGEKEPVELDNKGLSLKKAQELVGGYVQVIPMFNKYLGSSCVVLADEEGKMKGKDVNNRATLEWAKCVGGSLHGDMLVGDVVVLHGPAGKAWG